MLLLKAFRGFKFNFWHSIQIVGLFILLCLALSAAVTNVLDASPANRGTDQFWYLGAVESAVHSDGLSNHHFAGDFIKSDQLALRRPFIHNTPSTTFTSVLVRVTGWDALSAWIKLNLFSLFVVCLLMMHAVWMITRSIAFSLAAPVALASSSIYFISLSQMMPEIHLSLLTMVAFYLQLLIFKYLRPFQFESNCSLFKNNDILNGKDQFFLAIIPVLFLLSFTRSNFVLLWLVVPFFYLFWSSSKERFTYEIKKALGLLVIYVFIFVGIKLLSSNSLDKSIFAVLANGLQFKSNMEIWLLPDTLSLVSNWDLVLSKIWSNITYQIQAGGNQRYFNFFNYLALAILVFGPLGFKAGKEAKFVLFVGCLCIFLHLVTVAIHQNQARYMNVLLPVLLVCAASLSFFALTKPSQAPLVLIFCGIFFFSLEEHNSYLAGVYRSQAFGSTYRQSLIDKEVRPIISQNAVNVVIDCYDRYSVERAYKLNPVTVITIPKYGKILLVKSVLKKFDRVLIFCENNYAEKLTAYLQQQEWKVKHLRNVDIGSKARVLLASRM